MQAASTTINKRTTDMSASMSAGFPKRAKRLMEDFPAPSNGPAMTNSTLASLSTNERERLLQMLEQESTVRNDYLVKINELVSSPRRKNWTKLRSNECSLNWRNVFQRTRKCVSSSPISLRSNDLVLTVDSPVAIYSLADLWNQKSN